MMKKSIHNFSKAESTPINTIRTILLFGNNVSTYKFALCSALMKQNEKSEIKFVDLRDDFLNELYKHYITCPHQWTAGANSITKAFDEYKADGDWNKLIVAAEKNIYNNVFDAFHNVGGATISYEYRLFEHDKKSKKLVFTDHINKILESTSLKTIIENENQSRWLLVEEAWRNKLSPNLLEYDNGEFVSTNKFHERVNLRSAVDVLLPYQHGKCFYCNKEINAFSNKNAHDFPDVDHLLPFKFLTGFNILPLSPNGIWNLVIACQECNRGSNGKFDKPPKKHYFDKLLARNLLFTEEHRHSLKNSILLSLSANSANDVESTMKSILNKFTLFDSWEPHNKY
jgi:hypothetical protein